MTGNIKIKFPLIGNFEIEDGLRYNYPTSEEFENELSEYIKYTKKYQKILDILFPQKETVSRIARELMSSGKVDIALDFPLFAFHLLENLYSKEKNSKPGDDSKNFQAAWASLMYELGEFYLDEIDYRWYKNIFRCDYKLGEEWHIRWADFENAAEIIKEIWTRLTEDDVAVISIDDDEYFPQRFLGFTEDEERNKMELFNKLLWRKPEEPFDEVRVIERVKEEIEIISKKRRLIVFVVDLMFKGPRGWNTIKGDALIKSIRGIKPDSLIVGFTGGSSPFIINSAEKAGADIVVFKNRGEDAENRTGHVSKGDSKGVFDLLWAISWNVSVWRLFEEYKENFKGDLLIDIASKFFPSMENASLFWKNYLDKWAIIINEKRIKWMRKNGIFIRTD